MSMFKEAGTEQMELSRESDMPVLKESDLPRVPKDSDIRDYLSSASNSIYDAAFQALGFPVDTMEAEKDTETNELNGDRDHSQYLEKGEGGKYYDKETGKAYDSIEDWENAQETLAKRYEGTAAHYEEKAKKEWNQFENAEENGESDAAKWQHHRNAEAYYEKSIACREKATKIGAKLTSSGISNEVYSKLQRENEDNDSEVKPPIQNKIDGLAREKEVSEELQEKYPPEEGYEIVSEVYLRDENGNIVRDPESGEARRIDFVVVKDGKVVDSVEVTSKTADKTAQSAKEDRIRNAGGNYIRDNNGNLVPIPPTVQTRIERRD